MSSLVIRRMMTPCHWNVRLLVKRKILPFLKINDVLYLSMHFLTVNNHNKITLRIINFLTVFLNQLLPSMLKTSINKKCFIVFLLSYCFRFVFLLSYYFRIIFLLSYCCRFVFLLSYYFLIVFLGTPASLRVVD